MQIAVRPNTLTLSPYGPWSHDKHRLDVHTIKDEGDLSVLVPNGEWEVLGFPARREEKYFEGLDEAFVFLTYTESKCCCF